MGRRPLPFQSISPPPTPGVRRAFSAQAPGTGWRGPDQSLIHGNHWTWVWFYFLNKITFEHPHHALHSVSLCPLHCLHAGTLTLGSELRVQAEKERTLRARHTLPSPLGLTHKGQPAPGRRAGACPRSAAAC